MMMSRCSVWTEQLVVMTSHHFGRCRRIHEDWDAAQHADAADKAARAVIESRSALNRVLAADPRSLDGRAHGRDEDRELADAKYGGSR